ncbi:MAG: OmpH family outer membrane protein [Melioribacteraceae bacterium]|nr:OmpH family outer membrane protein [Melioribacteraceae bacterium]
MKKLSFILISLFLILQSLSFGQLQIGYVNSEAIIKSLPDAQDAQKKLDAIIQEWKEEITKMERELETKNTDFEKRKLVMSDNKRVVIEKEIAKMGDDISAFRQSKFGYKGELYTQQEEIMKPIQNKIFNAIEDVAEDEDLDYVFDKSGDIIFLYAKEEYDITAKVLEKLE